MSVELKSYNKYNYYRNTYAVFKEVNPMDLPFSVWQYTSKSGSSYYYTPLGVYRKSNHWGRAAKCRWVLMSSEHKLHFSKDRVRIGFALWSDFHENSEQSKSYFIKVDFENKRVTYDHKSRDAYFGKNIYRTAKETQKKIQKIKRFLLTDAWEKYYDFEDLEELRKSLINELLQSS